MNGTTPPLFYGKLHWIIFFWPVFTCIAGFLLWLKVPYMEIPGIFVFAIGGIAFIFTWMRFHASSIAVEQKQLILCTGFFVRQMVNIPLLRIESIDIRQPVLGSIFHYGTLIVTGTGGTRYYVDFLHHPLTCRRQIELLLGR